MGTAVISSFPCLDIFIEHHFTVRAHHKLQHLRSNNSNNIRDSSRTAPTVESYKPTEDCTYCPLSWISYNLNIWQYFGWKKKSNLKKIISCSEFLSQMPDPFSFHYKMQTGYFYNMRNSELVWSFFFKQRNTWRHGQTNIVFVSNNGHIFKLWITGKKQDKRKKDEVSVEWINSRQVAGWVSWQINTEMKPR